MIWRQPWLGGRNSQYVWFVGAGFLGVLLLSPWWVHSWNTWAEVAQAQAKLLAQQEATLVLRDETAQLLHASGPSSTSFADANVFSQLAKQDGLQLLQIAMDQPQQTASLAALQIQQVPVHLKVQGSWDGWLNWFAHWASVAPGVTVASLEMKADPNGGISAQMTALAPQPTQADLVYALPSVMRDDADRTDPFSAQAWVRVQRKHAAQHPSYGHWVVPELSRPREWLETFPRERLQYVGQIGSGSALEALVKVLPSTTDKKDTAMLSVHRVRVGSHLGQDFGKVLAIQGDQLVLQELAITPAGEWQTREVRLPLQQVTP